MKTESTAASSVVFKMTEVFLSSPPCLTAPFSMSLSGGSDIIFDSMFCGDGGDGGGWSIRTSATEQAQAAQQEALASSGNAAARQ